MDILMKFVVDSYCEQGFSPQTALTSMIWSFSRRLSIMNSSRATSLVRWFNRENTDVSTTIFVLVLVLNNAVVVGDHSYTIYREVVICQAIAARPILTTHTHEQIQSGRGLPMDGDSCMCVWAGLPTINWILFRRASGFKGQEQARLLLHNLSVTPSWGIFLAATSPSPFLMLTR